MAGERFTPDDDVVRRSDGFCGDCGQGSARTRVRAVEMAGLCGCRRGGLERWAVRDRREGRLRRVVGELLTLRGCEHEGRDLPAFDETSNLTAGAASMRGHRSVNWLAVRAVTGLALAG